MAHNCDKLECQTRRQQSKQRGQGQRPQGVRKVQRLPRTSARVNLDSGVSAEQQRSSTTLQQSHLSTTPQSKCKKRSRNAEDRSVNVTIAPSPKRPRPSPHHVPARRAIIEAPIDHIDYWRREQNWPKEYFEPVEAMNPLLARKKSTTSLRRKRSESSLAASSNTPSDQKPREEKSAPYRDARYETLLATKGSIMDTSEQGVSEASKVLCRTLLETEQVVPQESLFREDLFELTCRKIRNKNETRVIRDIALLIVPSAEMLATYGAKHLDILVESVNEGWNNAITLTGTRPQPDYSVGFKREAFSDDQLHKLSPFIGEFLSGDQSFFMATYYMYFPFLTCEVKCGAAALDVADRQNAHSMTLAARAVVELFRLVNREKEIHREILAFSVSHDYRSVRIYGHYAVIDGANTTFYRHPIHEFSLTALEGKEKWTAHKFTKNLYNAWMPTHFKMLCSAIDDLPSKLDFEVPPLLQGSGLSQGLESHHLSQTFLDSASQLEDNSELGVEDEGDVTPNTSFTQQEALKR